MPASNADAINRLRSARADALAAALDAVPAADTKIALDLDARSRLAGSADVPARVVAAVGPEGGFGANDWRLLDAAGFRRDRPRPARAACGDRGDRRLRGRAGAVG